jgi:hypothetical protein
MLLILSFAETSNDSEAIFAQGQEVPRMEKAELRMEWRREPEGNASEAADAGTKKLAQALTRE